MKTILIETVTNGWIVRPFQPCDSWASGDREEISVFTDLVKLKEALPSLLQFQPSE